MRFSGEQMQKIQLQQPVMTRSASGQPALTWKDADSDAYPYAHVRDNRGSEAFQADKKTAFNHRFFQIHRRTDLDETWTIVDEGKRYDIIRIHHIGNRKLDIEAVWTQGQYA